MTHFSTQMDIEPDRWDTKANRTLGQNAEEKKVNAFLDELRSSVQRFYYDMQASGDRVFALALKNKLSATEEKPIGSTMELFDKFISEYAEIVAANNYGKEALLRYKVTKRRVLEFFGKELKAKDLPLEQITKRLLDCFYLWLRSEYKVGNNTAILFLHKFSTVYKMAWDNGWVNGNPFHQNGKAGGERSDRLLPPVVPIPRTSLKSMLERILNPSTALTDTSYGGTANFSE